MGAKGTGKMSVFKMCENKCGLNYKKCLQKNGLSAKLELVEIKFLERRNLGALFTQGIDRIRRPSGRQYSGNIC